MEDYRGRDERERELIEAARRQAREPAVGARVESGAPVASRAPVTLPAESIPGYEIMREVHRGGQGVVYQAVQKSTRRTVAIKVMHEGPFAGPADRARFEREVEILAQLRHPNIVTIHDSGQSAGHFFYVMDYISGMPLHAYVASGQRSIRETLGLFGKICEAVNAAHLQGVIHRDLKPGNIRIDENGEPYILDFGLAKVPASEQEASLMTVTGQFVGSLPWSSPEQVEGQPGRIDVRTDVYSLGVILYQMLTGKFPYEVVGSMHHVLGQIVRAEPVRPSTIRRQVDDEVETIVLKCLQKEPERRYQTAGELARDVQRYLRGEPIEARRDHPWYVFRKAVSRHRLAAGITLLIVVLTAVSAIIMGALYRRADIQRALAWESQHQAEANAEALRVANYFNSIDLAQNAYGAANTTLLKQLLARCPEDLRGWEWRHLAALSDESVLTIRPPHADTVFCVCFHPDGRIWAGTKDGMLYVWDANDGRTLSSTTPHEGCHVYAVACSPDGRVIATGGDDHRLCLWRADTGERFFQSEIDEEPVLSVVFTPDNRYVLAAGHTIRKRDAQTGALIHTMPGHRSTGSRLAVSPDGSTLASGGSDGLLKLWDLRTGAERASVEAHADQIQGIAFSPDGGRVYTGGWDKYIRVWDADTAKLLLTFPKRDSLVYELRVAPGGQALALADPMSVRILDANTGDELRRYLGHDALVSTVSYSPDGTRLVSASKDGSVRVWDVRPGGPTHVFDRLSARASALACSADGRWVAVGTGAGTIRLYHSADRALACAWQAHGGWVDELAFSPDGRCLASGCANRVARLWDCATGDELHVLRGHKDRVATVAFRPDGTQLATGSHDGSIRLWSVATGELSGTLTAKQPSAVEAVAYSPDGSRFASGHLDGAVRLWDLASGALARSLQGHARGVHSLAFSPDGRQLVSGGGDWKVIIWDVRTGEPLRHLEGHRDAVFCVSFSHDGRRIVSASQDTTVRVWDAQTGRLALTLRGHDAVVYCAVFTPDDRCLLSCSDDRTIRIWCTGD